MAAIAFTWALLLAIPLALMQQTGIHGPLLWLFGVLAAVPGRGRRRGAGQSRRDARRRRQPLPGLALREGVPEHLRTLVAMPVLLNSRAAVEEHLHRLEIHYLASPDDQLHFALLTDWTRCGQPSTCRTTIRCSTSPSSASRG